MKVVTKKQNKIKKQKQTHRHKAFLDSILSLMVKDFWKDLLSAPLLHM